MTTMKKTFWGLLLTVGGLLCVMGFAPDSAPPDLSSPKATVRSFAAALSRKDVKAMAQCVQGSIDPSALGKIFDATFPVSQIEVTNLIEQTDNTTSRIAGEFTLQMPGFSGENAAQVKLSAVDIFTVEKHGENWLIVPDATVMHTLEQGLSSMTSAQMGLRPLASFVALVGASKEVLQAMESARQRAKATTCLSNAKQIALGVMMYVQDYDETFPRKKALYVDLVMPYIKNREVFTCPLDVKGTITYTFNANLQDASLASINSPAETVMLYEGKNMQLDYRHDGKAVVAFVDGHAKLIGPEAAKALFWYPEGAKPSHPVPEKPIRKPGSKPTRKKG